MKIFYKIKANLLLAISFSFFTFLSHIVYTKMRMSGTDTVPLKNYIILFIMFFIFSFIKQRLIRFFALGFPLILSFFQLMHMEFFGVPVFPAEILLAFTQGGEVAGVLTEELDLFILPLLLNITPLIFLFMFNSKIKLRASNKFLYLVFFFYIIFNPMRTFFTGNTWGRQPSMQEFEGINLYLSGSYFLGRILPAKLKGSREVSTKRSFTQNTAKTKVIILVLGESLTPHHMSLFGYNEKTTPFLDSLKNDSRFFYSKAYSSAVSSDVSVAFFLNNTYGDQGAADVHTGNNCLFKLAGDAGYTTHFYSTQSREQLRYIYNSICPKRINFYKDLEKISPNYDDANNANDLLSLNELKQVDLTKSQFVVLHQRGSHSPYAKRFTERFNKFVVSDNDNRMQKAIKYYDNSILEFDNYMKELYSFIDTLEQEVVVVYVSDHGEGLGENGHRGHGKLTEDSSIIPFLVYSNKKDIHYNFPKHVTQFNISLYLSEHLGFETSEKSSDQLREYIVYGNDMDGFMGYLKLDLTEDKVKLQKTQDY